jgi:hypothetical protein
MRSASYWHDGERHDLTTDAISTLAALLEITEARDVFVHGVDVYVAGDYLDVDQITACYWKNGSFTRIEVDGEPLRGWAQSIAVNASGIHVAGTDLTPERLPFYWKNGELIPLQGAGSSSYPKRLFLSGDDAYVTGADADGAGCYWKNGGSPQLLSVDADETAYISDLHVENDVVYVAGHIIDEGNNLYGAYWVNNEKHTVTRGAGEWVYVNDIHVADSKIYLLCHYRESLGSENGVYTLIDGVETEVPQCYSLDTSPLSRLFAKDDIVYVAGVTESTPRTAHVWTNYDSQTLSLPAGSEATVITSLLVK